MKASDLYCSYIDTGDDPKERIKVQLILFYLGFYWAGDVSLFEKCGRYIYIRENKLTLEHSYTLVTFLPYCNFKKIELEDIYKV